MFSGNRPLSSSSISNQREFIISLLYLVLSFHCFIGILSNTTATDTSSGNITTTSNISAEVDYGSSGENEPPEKILFDHILKGYDKNARPVTDHNSSLHVNVGIYLLRISDMDIKNQILSLYVWLNLKWDDPALRWNPEDFSNLTETRLPPDQIWVPDIEIYNSADDLVSLSDGRTPVVIKHNGSVTWIEPKDFRSLCAVDVRYFPFDQQTCKIRVGSWTHNGVQIELTGHDNPESIEIDDFAKSGEWTILKTEIQYNRNFYECCPEAYVNMDFQLQLKRKSMYYVIDTIIPCMIMSVVAVLLLTVSPGLAMRLTVQILVFVGFSFYIWHYTGVLPESPKSTSILLIYLMWMMMETGLSITATMFISKLYKLGNGKGASEDEYIRPVPKWIRFIVSNNNTILQFRTKKSTSLYADTNALIRDDIPLTQYAFTESSNQGETNNSDVVALTVSAPISQNAFANTTTATQIANSTNELQFRQVPYLGERYSEVSAAVSNRDNYAVAESDQTFRIKISGNQQHNKAEMNAINAAEWKLLARKSDNICFWALAVTTIFANIIILIMPILSN